MLSNYWNNILLNYRYMNIEMEKMCLLAKSINNTEKSNQNNIDETNVKVDSGSIN